VSSVRYVAVDPGKTVGFAQFNELGKPIHKGQMDWEKFIEISAIMAKGSLGDQKLTFIVEDFNLLPNRAQSVASKYSRQLHASQIIGAIRMLCAITNHELVLSDPQNLTAAQLWTGVKVEAQGHSQSHWKSAYNHGMFYFVQNKIRTVKDIRTDGTTS
jgi:hypothetical protein